MNGKLKHGMAGMAGVIAAALLLFFLLAYTTTPGVTPVTPPPHNGGNGGNGGGGYGPCLIPSACPPPPPPPPPPPVCAPGTSWNATSSKCETPPPPPPPPPLTNCTYDPDHIGDIRGKGQTRNGDNDDAHQKHCAPPWLGKGNGKAVGHTYQFGNVTAIPPQAAPGKSDNDHGKGLAKGRN